MTSALAYAERGIPVHPVNPGTKRPLTDHGVDDATTDPTTISSWWERWPGAGVAVATGRRSGLVVIDVDPRHGGEDGIAEAAGRLGSLPRTPMVTTPSGGWHYWLKLPEGVTVRNSAGTLAPGIDVRGDGGYVVAPPTRQASGAAWSWAVRGPLAPLPDEWAGALNEASRVAARKPAETWLAMLQTGIAEGGRNAGLTRLVGHLLSRDVDVRIVAELVALVNDRHCKPPLPGREVDQIVNSISAREVRRRTGAKR